MNLNDTYILEGLKRGDRLIFNLVFKSYYPALCAFARDYVRSDDIAEEITQELFLYLWENHSKIHIKSSLRSYLFRSIHNRCLNYFRDHYPSASKRARLKQLESHIELLNLEIPETIFDKAFSEQAEMELETAIESLPEQCKKIFRMNRDEKLSYPEIAGLLDISLSTVKTQMSRAMQKLAEKMEKYLGK